MRIQPQRPNLSAFTLVELLVVVSVIALLIAILLPSLRKARDQAKLVTCGSQLRQIGIAIHTYAAEADGLIPRGPTPGSPPDFEANDLATNQLWIGAGSPSSPTQHPRERNGLGPLLSRAASDPRAYFCPADDNFNRQEELPRIGTDDHAYGSYLYRQLDQLPAGSVGRLDSLGANRIEHQTVRVEALALDTNTLGPAEYNLRHTNHRAFWANLLFRDTSVARHRNVDNLFAVPESAFADYSGLPLAIDQVLINADVACHGDPARAPRIPTP
jgi:type II secretory pathway pseudopilin PulG